jgi:dihydrofolate reductase
MRRIIATTFISLDGVMQAPGGPNEDDEGGFAFGGWTFPHFDEQLGEVLGGVFGKPFDLLLGRKTYDIFAAHWPKAGEHDPEMTELFNRVNKHVATSGDQPLDWVNSASLGPDVVAALRTLKQGEGPDLLIQGSSDLIQTLLTESLIDEFTLLIFPVVLGAGKRLFGSGTVPMAMKLVSSRTFPTGVIAATYVPEGEVRTGSFALD